MWEQAADASPAWLDQPCQKKARSCGCSGSRLQKLLGRRLVSSGEDSVQAETRPWSEGGTEAEATPCGDLGFGVNCVKVGIWRADHMASEEVEAGGRVLGLGLNPKPGGPCEAI